MNGQRVYDYLNWSLIDHTAETLFDRVYQLRGGQAFKLRLNEFSRRLGKGGHTAEELPVYRWYELKAQQCGDTFDEASGKFR